MLLWVLHILKTHSQINDQMQCVHTPQIQARALPSLIFHKNFPLWVFLGIFILTVVMFILTMWCSANSTCAQLDGFSQVHRSIQTTPRLGRGGHFSPLPLSREIWSRSQMSALLENWKPCKHNCAIAHVPQYYACNTYLNLFLELAYSFPSHLMPLLLLFTWFLKILKKCVAKK